MWQSWCTHEKAATTITIDTEPLLALHEVHFNRGAIASRLLLSAFREDARRAGEPAYAYLGETLSLLFEFIAKARTALQLAPPSIYCTCLNKAMAGCVSGFQGGETGRCGCKDYLSRIG
jgi:hypothetical protein